MYNSNNNDICIVIGDSLQPTVERGAFFPAGLEEGVEGSGCHVPGSGDYVQQPLQQHGTRDVGSKGIRYVSVIHNLQLPFITIL